MPVHGVGETEDGRQFYVMRLIRGERLDEAIATYYQQIDGPTENTLDPQVGFHELLNHFVAVCKTIAYAHNRGVVHRDLKPANIMLGRYGETLVIDWGLAAHVGREGVFKDSNEKTLMPGANKGSSQNSGGGTPPYMSPEQAAGQEQLGPPSDIYSLGATLFHILTGQVAFGGTLPEVMQKVTRGEFPRPTAVRTHVSKALESICLKAMSRDPQRRYPTALELAEDVERFLADAPVSAYQEPLARRVARWARRNRTWAQSSFIAMLLLAAIGTFSAFWMGRQAHRERQLHAAAETARHSEQLLRQHGLQLSAEFAARTIANQIDLRWRILEKEGANQELHGLLAKLAPQDEPARAALQHWLEKRVDADYAGLTFRTWFIQASDGTQLARIPSQEEGKQASSLGKNFAYRDYFHGKGLDYSPNEGLRPRPLAAPHNSTVFRSTVDGELAVVLSVPIAAENAETIGVLAMSVELGGFADLQIDLPAGQGVLLVESRRYYMLDDNREPNGERGEGLVLHHPNLAEALNETPLPHLDDQIVYYMRRAKSQWIQSGSERQSPENLLPDSYRDPLSNDRDSRWLAAFAPVLVHSRPSQQHDTGWLVIVQQQR